MDTSCQGCRQRDKRIAALKARVAELIRLLGESERAGKRQAAPFSKGKPKKNPKTPGRKKGEEHGKHGHREPPLPDQVDETLEAPLPDQCPDCSGQDELLREWVLESPTQDGASPNDTNPTSTLL